MQIVYRNQGAIRSQPLSPTLERALMAAAGPLGIDQIIVYSGGQNPGQGTGSHRHDLGGAADIALMMGGRELDFTNPTDQAVFGRFVGNASQQGVTGFGAGTGYMGNTRIHVGYGTPAVWGEGGRGANAPEWLRTAAGQAPAIPTNVAPSFQGAERMPTATPQLGPFAQRLADMRARLDARIPDPRTQPNGEPLDLDYTPPPMRSFRPQITPRPGPEIVQQPVAAPPMQPSGSFFGGPGGLVQPRPTMPMTPPALAQAQAIALALRGGRYG